jgi:CHAD domain-containing protein
MKRKYLEEVIDKHGHRIRKYGSQLPGHFEAETLHELRLEYKKLRAFVRLLQMDTDASKQLIIPQTLKELYHTAGVVRDLQLFLPQLMVYAVKENTAIPVCLQYLEHRLFQLKEALVKAIEEVDVEKELTKITKALPKQLEDAATRKFIHLKVAAIQLTLLALEKDKELHSIRKHLKDIIYNIRIFDKDWGLSFPITAWRSEKRLQTTAEALGDFNDQCIALFFLSDVMERELPEAEKNIIKKWEAEKLSEKEESKQKITEQVHRLHLVSNFEQLA